MKWCVRVCVLILLCSGCGGSPSSARRVNATDGSGHYPLGEIHFVERGVRGRGVLVTATHGSSNPFHVYTATVLQRVKSSPVAGPAWTGPVGGGRARALAALPDYRDTFDLMLEGSSTRYRFRQQVAWVLGTDPLIIGLPSAEPEPRDRRIPSHSAAWTVRFAADEELKESVGALVLYPADYWARPAEGRHFGPEVTLVTLREPVRINDALDAIAAGDPSRLGTVRTVPEQIAPDPEPSPIQ